MVQLSELEISSQLARTQSMQLAASSLLAHRPSTEATQLQVPAESCSEYIYAVTITVEEEVNTEELPVMILEEEANGFELKTGEVKNFPHLMYLDQLI